MGMEPIYNEFKDVQNDEKDLIKALISMMESDKHLNMRTHIDNPYAITMFDVSGNYLDSIGMKESSKLVKEFSKTWKEHMVSYQRLGRTEFFSAITDAIKVIRRSLTDRLTGSNNEPKNK